MIDRLLSLPKICHASLTSSLLWSSIFVTERCNSKCKTCGIWKKKNPLDMPIGLFQRIINDVPNQVYLNITGGEALLHPKIDEILALLSKEKKSYTLFSNGILAEKLIETVRNAGVKSLVLSCDGTKETYRRVRGVDNFTKIVGIVDELKDEVSVKIDYTINPLNTKEDLIEIRRFCDSRKVYLGVGVYDNPEYFDTTIKRDELYDADGLASYPADRYIKLYPRWFHHDLKLPCYSIRFSCFILPNGDVLMCLGRKIVLGNLTQRSLDRIWKNYQKSGFTRNYKDCNGCWLLCQRSYDVALSMVMKTLVPEPLLNRIVGRYDWGKV